MKPQCSRKKGEIEVIEIDDSDTCYVDVMKDSSHSLSPDDHKHEIVIREKYTSLSPPSVVNSPHTLPSVVQNHEKDQNNDVLPTSSSSYPYPYRASAYVQHIAEACTFIMKDDRWRTCNAPTSPFGFRIPPCKCASMNKEAKSSCKSNTLLSWDYGDDLSAIEAFMKMYDGAEHILSENKLENIPRCHQILNPALENDHFSMSSDGKNNFSCKYDVENITENSDRDIVMERAMHLYSRMFHRKGPWFDLSDLYVRYYSPKKTVQQMKHQPNVPHVELENETSNEDEDVLDEYLMSSPNFNKAKSKTLQCESAPKKSSWSSSSIKSTNGLKNELVCHQTALVSLFSDVIRLCSMGLLRSFDSEYECGSVAGSVTTGKSGEGAKRGSLLLADERREVLRRLGGTCMKIGGFATMKEDDNGNEKVTNEIILQMQKQQSIFSCCSFGADIHRQLRDDQGLLPVRKHVDYILTRKFASKLVSLTSSLKLRKSDIDEASRMIRCAWMTARRYSSINTNAVLQSNRNIPGSDIVCTLRLREAPLKALRRCLRIFLCANGGPGAMRGDGTNGWLNISGNSCGLDSSGDLWHNVVYPGLSSRLGLSQCEFKHYYTSVIALNGVACAELKQHNASSWSSVVIAPMLRVFHQSFHFRLWEIGVEIRSFVDKSLEAYEIERTTLRRHLKKSAHRFTDHRPTPVLDKLPNQQVTFTEPPVNDCFAVLTIDGRRKIVQNIITLSLQDFQASSSTSILLTNLFQLIESDILYLHTDQKEEDKFISDTERAIVAIAVISHRILQVRVSNASNSFMFLAQRPWLRHFSFDSILAYVIWDCIPILERNGHHSMAVSFLITILYGSTNHSHYGVNQNDIHKIIDVATCGVKPSINCLLPRRNRGKAFERLVIDISHVDRSLKKVKSFQEGPIGLEDFDVPHFQKLCHVILLTASVAGTIPFSSIRNLARRLKVPLSTTMDGIKNDEINALKLRLDVPHAPAPESSKSSYRDWIPKTDFAIANALSLGGEVKKVGKRCTFVGLEDEICEMEAPSAIHSLSVEELALEEYYHGRLPEGEYVEGIDIKGNFLGFHCEGSYLRAIFRILCLQDLLGYVPKDSSSLNEHLTVFLTPYQTSPHDLHVGFFKINCNPESTSSPVRSFYERRRYAIESFLSHIYHLDAQAISNMVFNSVRRRWEHHMNTKRLLRDESLRKDVACLRTLSMIAGGLGGSALSSIFRCLFFDYRHYAGGLPDLLLVRARYIPVASDVSIKKVFVDLGEWIGESFSKENIEEKNINAVQKMLVDRDDEFLGCSKNSDSSTITQRRKTTMDNDIARGAEVSLPPKLIFKHNGMDVKVDCLLVEVKSANDKLDSRQEDWLNILDGCTNARVCKFRSKKPS